MPIGLFVMFALSVVAYRRARFAGKNPWIWVALVWVFGFGIGMAVTSAAIGIAFRGAAEYPSEEAMKNAAFFPAVIGMIMGALLAVGLAGWARRPA